MVGSAVRRGIVRGHPLERAALSDGPKRPDLSLVGGRRGGGSSEKTPLLSFTRSHLFSGTSVVPPTPSRTDPPPSQVRRHEESLTGPWDPSG